MVRFYYKLLSICILELIATITVLQMFLLLTLKALGMINGSDYRL